MFDSRHECHPCISMVKEHRELFRLLKIISKKNTDLDENGIVKNISSKRSKILDGTIRRQSAFFEISGKLCLSIYLFVIMYLLCNICYGAVDKRCRILENIFDLPPLHHKVSLIQVRGGGGPASPRDKDKWGKIHEQKKGLRDYKILRIFMKKIYCNFQQWNLIIVFC